MMYAQKMAACVKVGGKVLREHGEVVALPFGAEYSLSFKNLNTVRALVAVEIDGVSATDGTRLIVPANGTVELERFIRGGNLEDGNRLKFIERTARIEEHRGVGAEDGLVRVTFEFERALHWTADAAVVGPVKRRIATRSFLSTTHDGPVGPHGDPVLSYTCSTARPTGDLSETRLGDLNEAGITVPGARSDQRFTVGAWFPTDGVSHVLVFRLVGAVEGQPVARPVTVKHRPTCETCGRVNRATSRFCSDCGTALFRL